MRKGSVGADPDGPLGGLLEVSWDLLEASRDFLGRLSLLGGVFGVISDHLEPS